VRGKRRFLIGALCGLLPACAVSHRAGSGAEWRDVSPHRVRFVTVAPGVRLETLDWGGAGPPMVFLSGLQDVAHGFDDFAPRFTDRYHVVAITRRGYGASSRTASGYDLATRIADLRSVLDSLGLERVALVGHSMAGDELTAFAGAYPARVSRLVYLDAAYDHSDIDFGPGFWPPMAAGDSASPRAVQAYLQRTYGMHIPEAQLRAIGRYDAAGRLTADVTPAVVDSLMIAGCGHPDYARVRAPALLIYAVVESARQLTADWDALDRPHQELARQFAGRLEAWARLERDRARRSLAGAEVLEIPGANHYVFASHPGQVARAIRAFLSPTRTALVIPGARP
jgi:pimeloyl-ACP methyl ester carboxylesterase